MLEANDSKLSLIKKDGESEFDEIRPFSEGEIKQAIESLIADKQFSQVLKVFIPWMPSWIRNSIIRLVFIGVNTPSQFQARFSKPFMKYILQKFSEGCTFTHNSIAPGPERYTFVSNHRDIVLDSALLDLMLQEHHFPTTCEIAIGSNLLIYPWIDTLVKLNKAFTVKRGLGPKELFKSSQTISRYMHHVIQEKHENIWIAQREGRAKDSSDQTQDSLLKMFAMAGEGSITGRLKELCIVPLSISYEYDPCDYLKAKEFQLKRDNPSYKKSRQDDLNNMKVGIFGKKGHIHYEAMPCINSWLDEVAELPKAEIFTEIAHRIDQQIHAGYHLYPGNFVAADLLDGTTEHAKEYTNEEKKAFETYLQSRIDLIQIENKDEAFLRERLLTMYANPVINKQKALNHEP